MLAEAAKGAWMNLSAFEWIMIIFGGGTLWGVFRGVGLLMRISIDIGEFRGRFATVEKETGSQGTMLQQQGNLLSRVVGFLQGKGFNGGSKK